MKNKRIAIIFILLTVILSFLFIGFMFMQYGNTGKFYSLHEAYDNGWLTENDIKNIAYYYKEVVLEGGLEDENYIPSPKNPKKLSFEIKNKIKKAYMHKYEVKNLFKVKIHNYYGTYNNCVVVNVQYLTPMVDLLFEDITLGTVTIRAYSPNLIEVWRA